MKTCYKCKKSKRSSAFHVDNSRPDRLFMECKQCRKIQTPKQKESARIRSAANEKNRDYTKPNTRKRKSETQKRWAANNKEKALSVVRDWQRNNPSKVRASSAKSDAKRALRFPKWLNALQLDHIKLFYEAANALSIELSVLYEVDHIIPLRGKNISGLHVPWNLQVITKKDNLEKSNKF